jgi:rare lipoprotein A
VAAWLRSRPAETAGLGVIVEPAGDFLRLTWTRDTSAVRSATTGVLRIEDGPAHQDIILDPQRLSNGSILYRPASRDVTFRLEIRRGRRTAAETVRVVNGVGPAPPQPATTRLCSYYARSHDGHITASGERFDSNALTAAHLKYPMGTKLKLTNPANNKSVVVTVNDGGPFVKGREISVTRRAARELGFIKQGVATVSIEQVH